MVKLEPIVYAENMIPKRYKCQDCGAHGVKLWRGYQVFSVHLQCTACMCKSEKRELTDEALRRGNLGWSICAVPDEEGEGYWGFTSIPQAGCDWWDRLPITLEPAII